MGDSVVHGHMVIMMTKQCKVSFFGVYYNQSYFQYFQTAQKKMLGLPVTKRSRSVTCIIFWTLIMLAALMKSPQSFDYQQHSHQ